MACRKCGCRTPRRICAQCELAEAAEERARQRLKEQIENGEIEEDDFI